MKTILDKLKEDKELDNYYSLSELDSEKFIQEIIDYSISNEKETISFCKGIKPTEFCPLELVYQALSRDWARWGSFLSDEFIRVYNLAYKSIEQDYSDECLLEICPNDDVSDFSIDKIINFLAKEIQSEKLNRQHRSITFLTEWINDENYKKHQSIVQKIIEKSYGPNWKIRVVCFMFLNNLSQVNQEEHKIKFFDKFRTKFPLFFGDSTELIDLNKESSKVNNYKKLRYFNFIMALIFAFYPNQFSAFFIILFSVILLIPIVELIFSASKGKASLVTLIKYPIFDKNESEEIGFTFFDSINFTFILVALKLNRDFDFEKLSDGIIPVLIIVFSLMLVLLKIKQFDKISKNKYKINLMIFFNVFLYSSILTIGLNCLYDFSKPTIIKGIIEEKYISSDSKNREHYWVIVESWRNEMEPIKIQFTIDKYNQVQIRDTLNISKMQGFLKIPWYYVSEKVE